MIGFPYEPKFGKLNFVYVISDWPIVAIWLLFAIFWDNWQIHMLKIHTSCIVHLWSLFVDYLSRQSLNPWVTRYNIKHVFQLQHTSKRCFSTMLISMHLTSSCHNKHNLRVIHLFDYAHVVFEHCKHNQWYTKSIHSKSRKKSKKYSY